MATKEVFRLVKLPDDIPAIEEIYRRQAERLGRPMPLPPVESLESTLAIEYAGKVIGLVYFELELAMIGDDPRAVAIMMRPQNVRALKYHAKTAGGVGQVRLFPVKTDATTLGKRASRAGFVDLSSEYDHFYLNLREEPHGQGS